jgi:Recombinase
MQLDMSASLFYLVDTLAFTWRKPYLDPDLLPHLYLEKGLSTHQIADHLVCSPSTIKSQLKKLGIPLRLPHQHHGNPSQPRFGSKVRGRKLVEVPIEQSTIELIKQLRLFDFSLREIASALTKMKISTKKKGQAWHPEMVRRILLNIKN